MNAPNDRPDTRETLSALFDGELDGEARLFAMRRLGHDADWQRACGRWQLAGDALRRHAPIAAPAGFAARVSGAVMREAAVVAAAPAAPEARRRPRWLGGAALAASVALAAVVATPVFRDDTAVPAAAPAVVAAPSAARTGGLGPSPARATAAARPSVPPAATPGVRVAASARTSDLRSTAAASDAVRPSRGITAPVAVSRPRPSRDGAPVLAADPANPFSLTPAQAITAQPWPRAGLGGGAGALTASYGAGRQSAEERRSFYPFEPRPQAEAADAASQTP